MQQNTAKELLSTSVAMWSEPLKPITLKKGDRIGFLHTIVGKDDTIWPQKSLYTIRKITQKNNGTVRILLADTANGRIRGVTAETVSQLINMKVIEIKPR